MKLGNIESKFADIIWENEPLSSRKLVQFCEEQLEWKKSTTYTVLKKLCDRGIFRNENGIVSSRISRDEFITGQGEQFIRDSYEGSLPAFIAAFMSQNKLSKEEIDEIQGMIDSYRGTKDDQHDLL